MRKAITLTLATILLAGCQSIPWWPPVDNPDIPPVDDPVDNPPSAAYTFAHEYRVELPKVISAAADGNVPMFTFANVYHGGNRSIIMRGKSEVYRSGEETVTIWRAGDVIRLTPEHGSWVQAWKNGQWTKTTRTKGAWSVAGAANFTFFNNRYGNALGAANPNAESTFGTDGVALAASFSDEPVMIDAQTGENYGHIPAKGMPRCAVFGDYSRLYVSLNFGRECMAVQRRAVTDEWDVYDSPALTLAWHKDILYGAGSQKAGPSHLKIGDGKIYRWKSKDQWDVLFDTGCYSVPDVVDLGDRLIWIGVDPDRAYEMTRGPGGYSFRKIYERSGETARDRSFGGSGCVTDDGTLWIGWSDLGNWSEVFKVTVIRL